MTQFGGHAHHLDAENRSHTGKALMAPTMAGSFEGI